MTADNSGLRDADGNPGRDVAPADVVMCRECGNLVRRVNKQHLLSARCRFTAPPEERWTDEGPDEDRLRDDHPETVAEYKEMYPDAPVMSPAEREKLSDINRSEEADERRRELARAKWSGETLGECAGRIAEKHGVSESRVRSDWADRSEWMGRAFGLDDAEAVIMESLAHKKDLRESFGRLARKAEDSEEISEAIRALKAKDDNVDEMIQHQMDLNDLRAPDKTEVTVSGSVDHEHRAVGDGLDEDTLASIDAITGGGPDGAVDVEFRETGGGGGE